jgi:hypothetical protein
MVAFDLLHLNGYDLRKLPPIERKTPEEADRQDRHGFEVDGPEICAHTPARSG